MSQCTPLTSTLLLLACCWSCLVAAALAAAPPSPILVAAARAAPCSDIADRGQQQPRVYGFSVSADQKSFRAYDWSLLNGVGWATDPDQIEFAHSRGAQVELQAQGGVAEILSSRNSRRRWIQQQLQRAKTIGADGINFDLEIPIAPGAQAAADYTSLVREAALVFRAAIPNATISVDVPWSPYDVDGRNYDWLGLADLADMMFIMAYDIQSQIFGRCIASANAPIDAVRHGVRQWLQLGVPASKLVLGLPWYGYDYPCEPDPVTGTPAPPDSDICRLKPVPFQGSSCSDAAGAQRCYSEIMRMLRPGGVAAASSVRRDTTQGAPYFTYTAADGVTHQVFFDDPASLLPKYQVAVEAGLGGVGFWNLDCLAHGSSDPLEQRQTDEMWGAVHSAFGLATRLPANR